MCWNTPLIKTEPEKPGIFESGTTQHGEMYISNQRQFCLLPIILGFDGVSACCLTGKKHQLTHWLQISHSYCKKKKQPQRTQSLQTETQWKPQTLSKSIQNIWCTLSLKTELEMGDLPQNHRCSASWWSNKMVGLVDLSLNLDKDTTSHSEMWLLNEGKVANNVQYYVL